MATASATDPESAICWSSVSLPVTSMVSGRALGGNVLRAAVTMMSLSGASTSWERAGAAKPANTATIDDVIRCRLRTLHSPENEAPIDIR